MIKDALENGNQGLPFTEENCRRDNNGILICFGACCVCGEYVETRITPAQPVVRCYGCGADSLAVTRRWKINNARVIARLEALANGKL